MGFITGYFTTIWDTTILVHFFPSINLQLGWCWSWWANETTGLPVSLSNGPSTWATSLTWFAPTRWFCLIPFYPDKNLFGGIFWVFWGGSPILDKERHILSTNCWIRVVSTEFSGGTFCQMRRSLEPPAWKWLNGSSQKFIPLLILMFFFRISMVIIFRFHFPFLFFWECYHSLRDDEISVMLYKLSSDIPNDNLCADGMLKGRQFWINTTQVSSPQTQWFLS